jgi:hypothetical protein
MQYPKKASSIWMFGLLSIDIVEKKLFGEFLTYFLSKPDVKSK